MNDNEEKAIPSTSSQNPTTSKTVKKPDTEKPSTSKPPRSVTPEIDLDLQCDFAYSAYLRTIITNQMMEEKVQKNIFDYMDVLSQQLEMLQELLDKQFVVEREVKLLEVKREVRRVYMALKKIFDEVMNVVKEYNVDQNLEECIKVGEEEAGRVYTKNVKPLKDQDDYNKLVALVKKCNKSIENFLKYGTHPTEVKLLRDNVVEFQRLSKQFEMTRQLLLEQYQSFAYNAFKTMSDQFAADDKFKKS